MDGGEIGRMKYIDIERLRPLLPEGWEERAQAATEEVRAALPGRRAAIMNKHADLWRQLSEALAQLSHGKCWYCESRQHRSDNPVDHFRPKNRVAECKRHEGYWWLAFDWHNYRYSCTFCNSPRRNKAEGITGGKHDHFPLLDECARVFDESGDLRRESPELLDPTSPSDVTMLWFGDDGRTYPRCSEAQQEVQFRRAEVSIRLYHLNHPDVVEARLALYNDIRRLVNRGNDLFEHVGTSDPVTKRAYDDIVRDLQDKMSEPKEYTAAARDDIRGLRDNRHPWIDGL